MYKRKIPVAARHVVKMDKRLQNYKIYDIILLIMGRKGY